MKLLSLTADLTATANLTADLAATADLTADLTANLHNKTSRTEEVIIRIALSCWSCFLLSSPRKFQPWSRLMDGIFGHILCSNWPNQSFPIGVPDRTECVSFAPPVTRNHPRKEISKYIITTSQTIHESLWFEYLASRRGPRMSVSTDQEQFWRDIFTITAGHRIVLEPLSEKAYNFTQPLLLPPMTNKVTVKNVGKVFANILNVAHFVRGKMSSEKRVQTF